MSQFRGLKIERKTKLESVSISWKQGSLLGFGGDQTHIYKVYIYAFENGANILLFCQDSMSPPYTIEIDEKLQCGFQNGEMFLVLHDKSRTPFQFRFVENENTIAAWAAYGMKQLKHFVGYDFSWVAGEYLRDC
ncbi:hypothetical protein Bhyg_14995 [Pseudolycoriella hygida]|uniref:Uncharacterized protein n=1 Tax=Pseudolycoriella hygida TaxID=35572 RepID=A0A9Q0MSP6_9DIPT|nr:hypothetical protein Bhyg_14995 [Pseudolycoriella hygida]